jgi:hypothetical protein
MEDSRILIASKLAKEFVALCLDLKAHEAHDNGKGGVYVYKSGKHRAAIRRKSMDLTRALADMRRP